MPDPSKTALVRLLDLSNRVIAGRYSSDALDQALDSAIELVNAERGFIVVPDGENGYTIRSARNFDKMGLGGGDRKISTTLVDEVLRVKHSLFVVRPWLDKRFEKSGSLGTIKLRSVVLVPLLAHGVAQGALVLHETRRDAPFAEEDAKLAELVAIPAAHALEALLEDAALDQHREAVRRDRARSPFPRLVGTSPAMLGLYDKITRASRVDGVVLIRGETGTGKELVARTLHEESRRKSGPYVAVNVAAIPSSVLEAELFGHEKGAFTGAEKARAGHIRRADGGTLFLDEVGDLPFEAQVKVLRFLQEREVQPLGGGEPKKVDVRVVAATHQDLRELVARGEFREDLYYRLNVLALETPPLRERGDDIIIVADHLLAAAAMAEKRAKPRLSPAAQEALGRHPWPGNVRELANVMYRALVSEKDPVGVEDLELAAAVSDAERRPLRAFKAIDRATALKALEAAGGNATQAARELGISRSTFYAKLGGSPQQESA